MNRYRAKTPKNIIQGKYLKLQISWLTDCDKCTNKKRLLSRLKTVGGFKQAWQSVVERRSHIYPHLDNRGVTLDLPPFKMEWIE